MCTGQRAAGLSPLALSEPMNLEDSDVLAMFIKVSCGCCLRCFQTFQSEEAEEQEPAPACPPSS